MNNKGQSALEYLMTYGWALVVIVIVVAALFAFGVFNTPANCTQFGGRLLLKDFSASGSGVNLSVQNGGTGEMTGFSFASTSPLSCTGLAGGIARSAVGAVTCTGGMAAGNSYDVNVTYTLNSISHTERTICTMGG